MNTDWRLIQRTNFTQLEQLAQFLQLDASQVKQLENPSNFVMNVPRRLAEKMAKGTFNDPLFLQFIPLKKKDSPKESSLFVLDPVGDSQFRKAPKLLHKYTGRALLVCTSACAMHCRYCFRQNFEYEVKEKGFEQELEMIAEDRSLKEIILSGGDPLSLSDQVLKNLLEKLSAIPHIKRIRFHSRFPIGIPERINESLISILKDCKVAIWFVAHINHVRELDDDVLMALSKLRKIGIPLLNQSVLLKGVNDDVNSQKELCEELVNNGILPYYLHQLDQVRGTESFKVEKEEGLRILDQLVKVLPGYAIPKYVQEICGEPSKTAVI